MLNDFFVRYAGFLLMMQYGVSVACAKQKETNEKTIVRMQQPGLSPSMDKLGSYCPHCAAVIYLFYKSKPKNSSAVFWLDAAPPEPQKTPLSSFYQLISALHHQQTDLSMSVRRSLLLMLLPEMEPILNGQYTVGHPNVPQCITFYKLVISCVWKLCICIIRLSNNHDGAEVWSSTKRKITLLQQSFSIVKM